MSESISYLEESRIKALEQWASIKQSLIASLDKCHERILKASTEKELTDEYIYCNYEDNAVFLNLALYTHYRKDTVHV